MTGFVSPGLRLQLHRAWSADCTMCNRIKWKLTTRSWCRPWPPPSDVSSWSVLVSWSGRRIPRVAVVAAPATCAQSLSLVRRQGIGNLAQKVSVHCPDQRQDHIKRKTSVVCMLILFWVKIILYSTLHPTFILYWAKYITRGCFKWEKGILSRNIEALKKKIRGCKLRSMARLFIRRSERTWGWKETVVKGRGWNIDCYWSISSLLSRSWSWNCLLQVVISKKSKVQHKLMFMLQKPLNAINFGASFCCNC